MSRLDFNDDSEKALVDQVFNNAMESLADDDRELPQVILGVPSQGVAAIGTVIMIRGDWG